MSILKYIVIADRLRIRSNPSTEANVVGYLVSNEKIDSLADNGTWLKIDEGWVHKGTAGDPYVEKYEEEVVAKQRMMRSAPLAARAASNNGIMTIKSGDLPTQSVSSSGQWQVGAPPNENRWWYNNGNGTYPKNCWAWIDGNKDGIAECYCFDSEGWMYASCTTPDGYQVNGDGKWVENGQIKTKAVGGTGVAPGVKDVDNRKTVNFDLTAEQEKESTSYVKRYSLSTAEYADQRDPDIPTKQYNGILGMPYQFSENVDPRMKGSEYGYVYADRVLSRAPIVFFTPCRPQFMKGFNSSSKGAVKNALAGVALGISTGRIENVIAQTSKNGRYYSTKYAYDEFFDYLNPIARAVANLMGIGDVVYTAGKASGRLSNFDWSKTLNDDFTNIYKTDMCIPFYCTESTGGDDSFSNETTESQLSQKINSFSDIAREFQFMFGTGSGILANTLDKGSLSDAIMSIGEAAGDFDLGAKSSSFFGQLASEFSTVAVGGKLVFPAIWADSEYTKSYNIEMELRCNNPDPVSLYLDVMIPQLFLMCMAASQQVTANAYKSPFLLRVFYQGVFNGDMCIISDLNMKREGPWTDSGFPTRCNISVTVKDLYSVMSISNGSQFVLGAGKLMNNTALMDYMCVMANVNINKPEVSRFASMYVKLTASNVTSWPGNQWRRVKTKVINWLDGILPKV